VIAGLSWVSIRHKVFIFSIKAFLRKIEELTLYVIELEKKVKGVKTK
jgi:hypothetical protein